MHRRRLLHLAAAFAIAGIGAAAAAPTDDSRVQETTAALREADAVRPPATATLHGVVDSIDERNDAIRIRLSSGTIEPFKVQDGLLFNAVRFGDAVEVSVQAVAGARTIVRLHKE